MIISVVIAVVFAGEVVGVIDEILSPVDVKELAVEAELSALLKSSWSSSCVLMRVATRSKRENILASESMMSTDCDRSHRYGASSGCELMEVVPLEIDDRGSITKEKLVKGS